MENSVNNCNKLYFFKSYWRRAVMHSNSDNIKFTSYNDANEVINELLKSFRSKHQENLETSMKGSDFNFDSVQYYIANAIKLN